MISGTQQRPFFNLTTPGRIPFVANPAQPHQLADSPALEFDITNFFLNIYGSRYGRFYGLGNEDGVRAGGTNHFGVDTAGYFRITRPTATTRLMLTQSDNLLIGGASDQANGRYQLPTHTTAAGGLGFFDFSFHRVGAARGRTNGDFEIVKANPELRIEEQGVRAWNLNAHDGNLYLSALDSAGVVAINATLQMGNGAEKFIVDSDGNPVLRKRAVTVPTTLAHVISVLQYHGLCSS